MRVIAGKARGCKLVAPNGQNTRPTLDRMKEDLFNIVNDRLYDAVVLDTFAGSGAIGIEALSRGAKNAVFVEFDKGCCEVILKNLQHTRLLGRAKILQMDYLQALTKLAFQKQKFDVIFSDAPYDSNFAHSLLKTVAKESLLDNGGLIVLEVGAETVLEETFGFKVCKEKKYKTTKFVFLE